MMPVHMHSLPVSPASQNQRGALRHLARTLVRADRARSGRLSGLRVPHFKSVSQSVNP